jgi:hypothetical protein
MITIHLSDEQAEYISTRSAVMYQEELEKGDLLALEKLKENHRRMMFSDFGDRFYEINYEDMTVRMPAHQLQEFDSGLFEKIENKLYIR